MVYIEHIAYDIHPHHHTFRGKIGNELFPRDGLSKNLRCFSWGRAFDFVPLPRPQIVKVNCNKTAFYIYPLWYDTRTGI